MVGVSGGVLGCYQEPGAQGLRGLSLARVWWMVSCPLLPRSPLLLWGSCPAAVGDPSGAAVFLLLCWACSYYCDMRPLQYSWWAADGPGLLGLPLSGSGSQGPCCGVYSSLSSTFMTNAHTLCLFLLLFLCHLVCLLTVFCYKCSN